MFRVEKYTENNDKAQKVLGTLKLNNVICDEDYYAIKSALEDAKYTICQDYNNEYKTDGEVLGRLLEDAVNSSGFDTKGFIESTCNRAHRYLQGEIFEVIRKMIIYHADKDDVLTDGRNAWVKTICKKLKELL